MLEKDRILYEDNHLIIVNKKVGELVQGDETGDKTLADEVKEYLKVTYNKPGNVYLGIPHRLDRPTSGIVVYAKTEKALIRLNDMFRGSGVKKVYWAIVDKRPLKDSSTLIHYIVRNSETNKSIAWLISCFVPQHGGRRIQRLQQNAGYRRRRLQSRETGQQNRPEPRFQPHR